MALPAAVADLGRRIQTCAAPRHAVQLIQGVAQGRFPGRAWINLCIPLALLAAGTAHACVWSKDPRPMDETAYVNNDPAMDTVLRNFRINANAGQFQCASSGTLRVLFTPSFPSLRFVRNVSVDGVSYPAYEFSATSPLIVLQMLVGSLGHRRQPFPIRADQPTQVSAWTSPFDDLTVTFDYAVVSRGSYMTDALKTNLGTVTTRLVDHSTAPLVHNVSLGVMMRGTACAISDASVVLADASLGALDRVGASWGEKSAGMRIDCPAAGTRVYLSVTDGVEAGNTSDRLTSTPGSTATGVALQVLLNGSPVPMKQLSDLGRMSQGSQVLPLGARYLRTGQSVQPGTVNGRAVVTATYQ